MGGANSQVNGSAFHRNRLLLSAHLPSLITRVMPRLQHPLGAPFLANLLTATSRCLSSELGARNECRRASLGCLRRVCSPWPRDSQVAAAGQNRAGERELRRDAAQGRFARWRPFFV